MRCLFGLVVTWMLAVCPFAGPAAAQPTPLNPAPVAKETAPPVLRITAPRFPTVVNDVTPAISLEYSDEGSGVDLATLRVMVDSTDVTPGCTAGTASATCEPTPLAAGSHTITARLADLDGNLATASFTFNLLLGLGPHTVAFQAAADTYLQQGNPNENKGGETTLSLESRDTERALVRFDGAELLSALKGTAILAAAVDLYIESNSNNAGLLGRTVEAHRMTANWSELGATWTCPVDSDLTNDDPNCATPWNGGSFAALPTSLITVFNGQQGKLSFTVTTDLIGLLGGTPAHGWMFKMVKRTLDRQSGGIQVTSREGTAASQRPKLVVTFLTPLLPLDTTPPSLTITSPANGTVIHESSPQIRLTYLDTESGVSPTTLRVFLDGTELGAACTPGAYTATCQSPALTAGSHTITARVRDHTGNQATASSTFQVDPTPTDTTPPTLAITAPVGSVLYNEADPTVTVQYSDAGSGVSTATLRVSVDGVVLTGCTVGAASATCQAAGLTEGSHAVAATIRDVAGNPADARLDFELVLDADPPGIFFTLPSGPVAYNDLTPEIAVDLFDAISGIDPASFRLTLDGSDSTTSCTVSPTATEAHCTPPALAAGSHTATAEVRDGGGNLATASLTFEIQLDEQTPAITITAPSSSSASAGQVLKIGATYSDGGAGIDPTTFQARLDGAAVTDCAVGSSGASCSGPLLAEGSHTIEVTVHDRAGNEATASLPLTVSPESTPPALAITSPAQEAIAGSSLPAISVEYSDASGIDVSSLAIELDGADITAGCQAGPQSASCPARLASPGPHVISAAIRDTRGNLAQVSIDVELSVELAIAITSPVAGTLLRETTIDVEGTVSPFAESVVIGGIQASLSNGTFVAQDVPIREGGNTLTAIARSAAGGIGSATITLVRDSEAPRVVVNSPRNGFVTTTSQIVVAGEVVDTTSSNAPAQPLKVRVNDLEPAVELRTFLLSSLLLQPGENTIRVTAEDGAGNVGTTEIKVTFAADATTRMEPLLGDLQEATVGETLAQPLVVRLTDFAGNPLPGRPVTFDVTRGDGAVVSLPDVARELTVQTDEQGFAEVRYALGRRAGSGNHQVTVTSPGVPGSFTFHASARTGDPKRLSPITGNDFLGAKTGPAGGPYPKPLVAQVFDQFGNPVPGVDILFRVVSGGGSFAGASTVAVTSDREGKAGVIFTLGPDEGINNNLVEATFEDDPEPPASFVISGLVPGPEAGTSISGLVLDPQDLPVPHVRMYVGEVSTFTDAEGRFRLNGVPVGTVHLDLDGSTVTRPGTWPNLGYELVTISGRDNSVGKPLRLPQVDPSSARLVGGPEDVTVQITGVPGATMTVFANSATFPDGSKTGMLSFTQVPSAKVPMVAPFGSSFQVAWTLQPPGVHFDPPARVSIPNFGASGGDGNDPGMTVEIFSFDHDLGEFVDVGTASISEDGRQMISNLGLGVTKTGWGGCPKPPAPPAAACGDGTCNVCGPSGPVSRCDECSICEGQGGCQLRTIAGFEVDVDDDGSVTPPVAAALGGEKTWAGRQSAGTKIGPSDGPVTAGVGQKVELSTKRLSSKCQDAKTKVKWEFGDGEEMEAGLQKVFHTYRETGTFTVRATLRCEGCPNAGTRTETKTVTVVDAIEGRFKIADQEMALEVKEDDEDGSGHPDYFFRVLGGMRVKLSIPLTSQLLIGATNLIWTIDEFTPVGKFFDGYGPNAQELTPPVVRRPDQTEIYYEAEPRIGYDVKIRLFVVKQGILSGFSFIDLRRRIKTRVLNDSSSDGDDVKMLQSALGQIGFTGSVYPGVNGRPPMVNGNFDSVLKLAAQRFKFVDGLTGCVHQGTPSNADRICLGGAAETVDDAFLAALKIHVDDYRKALELYPSTPRIDATHFQFLSWIEPASTELKNTYSDGIHATVAPGVDYNELLRGWIEGEVGTSGHWGSDEPYVATLSSGDELASIGFDQILNQHRYGPRASSKLMPLNLYEPRDNVMGFAVFLNNASIPGAGGFELAFTTSTFTHTANFAAAGQWPRIGNSYTDTNADRLAKGVASYNTGPGLTMYRSETWPEILKNHPFGTDYRTAGAAYSIRVRVVHAGHPARCWTWEEEGITTGPDDVCDSGAMARTLGDTVVPPPATAGIQNRLCVVGTPRNHNVDLHTPAQGNDLPVVWRYDYCEAEWYSRDASDPPITWEQVRDSKRPQVVP